MKGMLAIKRVQATRTLDRREQKMGPQSNSVKTHEGVLGVRVIEGVQFERALVIDEDDRAF
jgi:hypothetical protein